MHAALRTLGLAVFGLVAPLPGTVHAQEFSDVFFFGDSLSDTGNACSVLQLVGYAPGRCSNGDVWSDFLAASLGLDATASISGGNNFANGGDTTAELDLQIGLFTVTLGFPPLADPDALYVIWLGGNDVLDLPGSAGAMQWAVDDIIAGMDALRLLGARHFLVANLPDVGRAFGSFELPSGSGPVFTPVERDLATMLSLEFNAALAVALAEQTDVTVFALDVFGLVEEVFSDPASFGVAPFAIDTTSDDTDFGIPCLVDGPCSADPQGAVAESFLFFDAIHPTTAMHEVIGQRAAILVPEPAATPRAVAVLTVLATLRTCSLWRRKNHRPAPHAASARSGC
jgi:phospholipase/lecithinase/hemolysin